MTDQPDAPNAPDDLDEEDDPLLDEILHDALAPYVDALTPEQLADYRAFLAVFITTHPATAPRYQRLRERQVRKASDARARDEASALNGAAPLPTAAGKERP